ncbi:MAG: ferritin family protein [Chloroflexi bacterium]|nr:ferritin family protein [Chloroflexota bacterium]
MPISLSASELLKIAVGIERRGIAFYDVMAKSVQSAETASIFQRLARMEQYHVKVFQGMLDEADKYEPAQVQSAEYDAYLQALSDNAVFTDEMLTSEMATRVESALEALELAIAVEKDSILFYYEMKEALPPRVHAAVNRVITEEKSHLRQLSEVRKKLAAT